LPNVPAVTSASQIGLSWEAPVFTGASPLIDYKLWYDNASGTTWEVFTASITDLEYTVTGLVQGSTY
jgi:hypothetical protein